MKKRILNIIKSIAIVIGFFIVVNLLFGIFYLSFRKYFLSEMLATIITVGILVLIYHNNIIHDFKTMKWKENFFGNLKYFFLAYGLMIFCNFIIYLIVGDMPTNDSIVRDQIVKNIIIESIDVALIGPFYEEILFRLNFRNALKKRIPFILITGILFGCMHLINATSTIELLYSIPYCIMGIMLSYTYDKTDNIFTSILLHSFNNTIALVLMFIGG